MLTDLARNAEERQILEVVSSPIALGRPYLAPPGIPVDRLALLRSAFSKTMQDEAFVSEVKKMDHEINPLSADETARVVSSTINAPRAILEKAMAILGATE
jgi:tripartite-type tricarboxylate transporter receptor subunit TctC